MESASTQLELFGKMAGFSSRARIIDSSLFAQSIQAERDERRSGDWEQSVIDYLEFMGGIRWRRGRPRYRESPTYLWYLGGLRLMASVRHANGPCNCPYCIANHGYRENSIGPEPECLRGARLGGLPPKKPVTSVRSPKRKVSNA
jgi:hypothetical protein